MKQEQITLTHLFFLLPDLGVRVLFMRNFKQEPILYAVEKSTAIITNNKSCSTDEWR